MKHFTYRIEHPSGFYYLGVHSGNPEDNYMGSGVLINHLVKLYPDGWTKTILCYYPNKTEAQNGEKTLVGYRYKNDPYCLNIKPGGRTNQKALTIYYKEKMLTVMLKLFELNNL